MYAVDNGRGFFDIKSAYGFAVIIGLRRRVDVHSVEIIARVYIAFGTCRSEVQRIERPGRQGVVTGNAGPVALRLEHIIFGTVERYHRTRGGIVVHGSARGNLEYPSPVRKFYPTARSDTAARSVGIVRQRKFFVIVHTQRGFDSVQSVSRISRRDGNVVGIQNDRTRSIGIGKIVGLDIDTLTEINDYRPVEFRRIAPPHVRNRNRNVEIFVLRAALGKGIQSYAVTAASPLHGITRYFVIVILLRPHYDTHGDIIDPHRGISASVGAEICRRYARRNVAYAVDVVIVCASENVHVGVARIVIVSRGVGCGLELPRGCIEQCVNVAFRVVDFHNAPAQSRVCRGI